MYEYRPPHRNVRARLIALFLFLLAVAMFVTGALAPKYPVIFQAVGLFLLVPTIQIVTRYIIVQYLYRYRPTETGDADLEIYSYRGGARMQLVCRVAVSEIKKLAPLTSENRRPPHALRRYGYCVDMRPADAVVLSVENADGACEILISPDEKLRALLTPPPPISAEMPAGEQ